MNDADFQELITSVRQAGAINRGAAPASREFVVESEIPDVRDIRSKFNLSQTEFASMLGISVATLRNWEQGRRSPEGPARVLLSVAARHPKVVWSVVNSSDFPTNPRKKTPKPIAA